jgi:hypothetical protein
MSQYLVPCEDCGRPYRADILKSCPGCGHDDNASIAAMDPSMERGNYYTDNSSYLPPYTRKSSFSEGKSFFRILFNHRFEDFVFVRVASAFYLWILIVSSIALVILELITISGFFNGLATANDYYGDVGFYLQVTFWPFIGIVVGLPSLYLILVIVLRLILEAGVALINIAENTSKENSYLERR